MKKKKNMWAVVIELRGSEAQWVITQRDINNTLALIDGVVWPHRVHVPLTQVLTHITNNNQE